MARGMLMVRGRDAAKYVSGLCTQKMPQPGAGHYAAFLNSLGRVLYDAFVFRPAEDAVLVEADRRTLGDMHTHMMRYRLRSDVAITDVSADYSAVLYRCASFDRPPPLACTDPRFPPDEHVYRVVQASSADSSTVHKGMAAVTDDEYDALRMVHGVAEGPEEIPRGRAIPLEYNMDILGAIDTAKGCYLGQELVARTLHRGVVRRRVVPLRIRPGHGLGVPRGVRIGADLVREGGSVGRIVAVCGDRALGVIRLCSDDEIATRLPSWDECVVETVDGSLTLAVVSRNSLSTSRSG